MNSQNKWDLHVDPGVINALKKILTAHARRLFDVIHLLPLDPFTDDIQKIKGEGNV